MVTKSTTATAAATTTTKEKLSLGRVLVIGGCGFLGHHVVRLLLRDWNCTAVSVVDLRCTRNRRPDSDGVEYVEADITDADNLVKILGRLRPDVVIHTASPPAQGSGAVVNAVFKKVNVDGTRAVVAACQQADVKALVYTSSASVMSDNRSDLINASEEWPVIRGSAQSEYYSETKVSSSETPPQPPIRHSSPRPGSSLADDAHHHHYRPKPKSSCSPRTAPNPTAS